MKKHKVILFNGLPGSGKLTIAELLAKKTGAKVLDNHYVNNLIFNVKEFEDDVPSFIWDFIDRTKVDLYNTLSKLPQTEDYILTGCLMTTDKTSLPIAEKFAKDLNSEFIVINLVCNQAKILGRINSPERKNRKKLTDIEVYKKVIDDSFMMFPKDSVSIDNSYQNASETLADVLKILDK